MKNTTKQKPLIYLANAHFNISIIEFRKWDLKTADFAKNSWVFRGKLRINLTTEEHRVPIFIGIIEFHGENLCLIKRLVSSM